MFCKNLSQGWENLPLASAEREMLVGSSSRVINGKPWSQRCRAMFQTSYKSISIASTVFFRRKCSIITHLQEEQGARTTGTTPWCARNDSPRGNRSTIRFLLKMVKTTFSTFNVFVGIRKGYLYHIYQSYHMVLPIIHSPSNLRREQKSRYPNPSSLSKEKQKGNRI